MTPGTPAPGAVTETLVLANVRTVGVGTHHVCALGSDGRVRCWGHALFGATGFAAADDPGPTFPCVGGAARCQAIEVVPLPATMGTVVQLSTRQTLSCARDGAGAVACWGTLGRGDEGIAPTRFRLAR
jgi:alpha-tubulin suppressor-like RCC1 family protein